MKNKIGTDGTDDRYCRGCLTEVQPGVLCANHYEMFSACMNRTNPPHRLPSYRIFAKQAKQFGIPNKVAKEFYALLCI